MHAFHQGQRLGPEHIANRHFAVQMREQRTPARDLPFQRIAQGLGLDRNQEQSVQARKVFGCGLGRLRGG